MANGLQLKSEVYRAGSFVYIEGQKDSKTFYIVRQGKLQIQRDFNVLEDENPILNVGDFFGVVSCMSAHPRDESAKALVDSVVISILRDHFGALIQKNAPIAMKIIRSFSKKLRYFDKEIARLTLQEKESEEDPKFLFDIGEYYFNQNEYDKSAYAFQQFLKYCPADERVTQAQVRLKQMNKPFEAQEVPSQGLAKMYAADQMIFSEHEPGEDLYIIQQGKVKITKIINNQEVLLAVLQPGDIFGEMALLENKPRSASAISYGDSVMLVVNKSNFESMVVAKPQIASKLIQLLSERIWTAYKQLENLKLKDPVARLWDTLLTQVLKQRVPIEHKAPFTFEFGPNELIKMVGFSEEEGQKYIKQLFENKKLILDNGKIHCTDLEEIQKQVSYYKKMQEMERKRELAAKKNL